MPINTTTLYGDRQVVYDLMDASFSGEFYDDRIATVNLVFKESPYVTKVSLPAATSLSTPNIFLNCTSLEAVEFPNITEFGAFNAAGSAPAVNSIFQNCANLTRCYVPLITHLHHADAFNGCTNLPDDCGIPWGNIQYIAGRAFKNCTSLVNLSLSSLKGLSAGGGYGREDVFDGCTSLRRLYMPLLTYSYGNDTVIRCPALEILRVPAYGGTTSTNTNTAFLLDNSTSLTTNLKLIDLGGVATIREPFRLAALKYTKILILRKTDSNVALAGALVRDDTTSPMKVYVPSALISTYQSASNWASAYSNGYITLLPLEGSPYEEHDFDDTAIYNADRSTL